MNFEFDKAESSQIQRWAQEHKEHWDFFVRSLSIKILEKIKHPQKLEVKTVWDAKLKPSGGYSLHIIIPATVVKENNMKSGETVKLGVIE